MKRNLTIFYLLVVFMSFEIQAINTRLETTLPLLSWLKMKLRYDLNVPGEIYAGIIATAFAAEVAYDVSWHGDYETKVNNAFNRFSNHIYSHNISALKDPSLYSFFNENLDHDFCLLYESWLRNSYDSWLKPWNWRNSQKAAYQKVEVLAMIALHGPLLILDQQMVDQVLVSHARKHCSAVSEYPLVYYADQIDLHLVALKKGFSIQSDVLQKMLLELERELNKLKYILRGNAAYIAECQTLQTHKLLKELAQYR